MSEFIYLFTRECPFKFERVKVITPEIRDAIFTTVEGSKSGRTRNRAIVVNDSKKNGGQFGIKIVQVSFDNCTYIY